MTLGVELVRRNSERLNRIHPSSPGLLLPLLNGPVSCALFGKHTVLCPGTTFKLGLETVLFSMSPTQVAMNSDPCAGPLMGRRRQGYTGATRKGSCSLCLQGHHCHPSLSPPSSLQVAWGFMAVQLPCMFVSMTV